MMLPVLRLQVFTGVADGGSPFGGSETIGTSLDTTLQRWGLTDPLQRQELRDSIKQSSERLMLTLIRLEEKLSAEERGGVAAQTEMIGEEDGVSALQLLVKVRHTGVFTA